MVTLPEPVPGEGEALIAVTSAPLNPVELRVAAGCMPGASPPYVPGLEGVGTVIASPTLPAGTRVRFENDLPGFGKDGSIRAIAVAEPEAMFVLPPSVEDAEADVPIPSRHPEISSQMSAETACFITRQRPTGRSLGSSDSAHSR